MQSSFLIQWFKSAPSEVLRALEGTWYIWLPAVLAIIFYELWMHYIQARFIKNIEWVLLEIKLPREISKTPKAMEIVLNGLQLTKGRNLKEKYWVGIPGNPWFSLELVGINGEIHFFVYCQKFHRNLIEAQFYSQYPDIEIVEVDDYTSFLPRDDFLKEWGCFGMEFALTKEDAYPIRTYIDYGLHEASLKEEQKNDPMVAFLELLGRLKEGEQIWFQILVRSTAKKWKEEGEKLINKIIGIKEGAEAEEKMKAVGGLHAGQSEIIKAIQRSISKPGFDIGIRSLYIAQKDKFNPIYIASIIGAMKQYNSDSLNGFKPTNTTSVDYFWQFKKIREAKMKAKMVDAYRLRSYFYWPYERKSFVLNSEELATIYHFPGRVAETPTFRRIESRKSEPPPNLPL